MKIISDTHVHSTFSFDGTNSMEEMVQSALAKDLKVIGFTEHIDFNITTGGADFFDYEGYSREIERVRERYGNQILILKGIEFSEPHLNPKEFEKELKRKYDLIMVGLHWFDDLFYGDPLLPQKYSKEAIFERYYRDLKECVSVGQFDVLAHFDLPTRYLGDYSVDQGILEGILETLVQNRIVPEINTSRFRNGATKTMPDRKLLDLYHTRGGRRITFGSDSHSVEVIGANFDQAVEYLEDILNSLEYGFFVNRRFQPL